MTRLNIGLLLTISPFFLYDFLIRVVTANLNSEEHGREQTLLKVSHPISAINISATTRSLKHHVPRVDFKYLERLGELYYENQKKERGTDKGKELIELSPEYPCVRGITPLGLDTSNSVLDGHKFGCGVHSISSSPIVYSFGSNKKQDFESAVMLIRPDSKVFTFEIDKSLILPQSEWYPGVTMFHVGLGYDKSNPVLKSLRDIMVMLNHTYIDILKMDIEGAEWLFVLNEINTLRNVGQFLVELHVTDNKKALPFLQQLESVGLRLFFKELNCYFPHHPRFLAELALIQSNWGDWDSKKKSLIL